MSLVKNNNPADFLGGCLREKNTHLERLDDTTDRYDISWKVANTLNCILIYNVGSQKRYNMDFL